MMKRNHEFKLNESVTEGLFDAAPKPSTGIFNKGIGMPKLTGNPSRPGSKYQATAATGDKETSDQIKASITDSIEQLLSRLQANTTKQFGPTDLQQVKNEIEQFESLLESLLK